MPRSVHHIVYGGKMAKQLTASHMPAPFLQIKRTLGRTKRGLRDGLLTPEAMYRFHLRRGGKGPYGYPDAPWHNAVLLTHQQVQEVDEQVQRLGLPSASRDATKNWDSL